MRESLRRGSTIGTLTGMSEEGSENSLKDKFTKTAALTVAKVGLLAGATLMGGSGDNVDHQGGNTNAHVQENHQALVKPEVAEFAVNPDYKDFKNTIDRALDPKGMPGFFNQLNHVVTLSNNEIAKNITVKTDVNSDGEVVAVYYFFNKDGHTVDNKLPNDLAVIISKYGKDSDIDTRLILNIDKVGLRDRTDEDTLANIKTILAYSPLDSESWDKLGNNYRRTIVEGDKLKQSQTIDLERGLLEIGTIVGGDSPLKPNLTVPLFEPQKPSNSV